jgi:hypothetical protein
MGFFEDLMSPLGKEHCMFFYYLGYISLALILVGVVVFIMSLYKKSFKLTGLAIYYLLFAVMMYYVYRLNYSVCLSAFK